MVMVEREQGKEGEGQVGRENKGENQGGERGKGRGNSVVEGGGQGEERGGDSGVRCPPKLVSYRNNRNWNRNQFRHYPKQDVCFGCFAIISKQGVSMFRNNRNKQKTNRNSSKFVKISTFLTPHTLSSVCFGCFDTSSKHQNKPKTNFLISQKNKPNLKQIEFRFVSVQTEKKTLTVSRTP